MKKCPSKMFRQFFALLLCAVMLFPLAPAPVPAAAVQTSSGMTSVQTVVDQVRGLYAGGKMSNSLEFDCGNGLTGGGEKSYMTMVTGTTASHFSNFQKKLKNAGYTVKREHTIISNSSTPNSFGSYLSPDGSCKVYTYFFPDYGETRIIVDTQADTVEGFVYEPQSGVTVEPKMAMWGVCVSPADGPMLGHWSNCGGMIVIRMSDNSLFLYDGGDKEQWGDEACDGFLEFCRELTGTTGTNTKMVINTWFMSHAHKDHYQGFYRFINKYHDQFDMKNVVYTIDKERSGNNFDITGLTKLLSTAYPNVRYYKPHTGESFNIAGVTFDIVYTLEDRFLPNSSNELIIDDNNRGGTYREGLYKVAATQTYDFNDTSTVLRITFENGVSSLLYGDSTRAKSIYKTVYPTGAFKTDIMQVPHHGHNNNADMVEYADAKVYLYVQNKKAAYGPDNDVSTVDMYGTYVETNRERFITMFPDMYVPAGTENVDYDIFWSGNEVVTMDINTLGKVLKGTSTAKYYTTQPALQFDYTGWKVTDLSGEPANVLLGLEDQVIEDAVAVKTTTIRYNPVATGMLQDNGRYIIKHKATNTIMSYEAVAQTAGTPNKGNSLWPTSENPVDASRFDLYYETGKGVYLDHSNRDRAMWILNQEGTATDAKLVTGPLAAMYGGKAYGEVWLNKGNATEWDTDGNKTEGRNGVYWSSVYGQDSNSTVTQYRFLDPRYADDQWVKTSAPTSDDTTDPKKRYVIEDLGDGDFLVYWRSKSGQTMSFLTCDADGNWGVKQYTDATTDFYPAVPEKGSAELEKLKLNFYLYKAFTSSKNIQFSGYKTIDVKQGATLAQVLSCIQDNISLTDTTRQGLAVPCSGTIPKIGYCYLKFNKTFDSGTNGTYTVSVMFRNDDNTDTEITTLTVNMLNRELNFEGTTTYYVQEGVTKDAVCNQIAGNIIVTSVLSNDTAVFGTETVSYSAVPTVGSYWLEFDSEFNPSATGDYDYIVNVNYRKSDGSDILVKTLEVYVDEPVVGTIEVKSASLSFEDEILSNLYYTISNFEATEMGLLTWAAQPEDGTIDNAENVYVGAVYDTEKGRYMVRTAGIAAKNLGDDIYMCVYAKTADSIIYSDVVAYSPKQYAMSRLEKSTSETMKALCVAMLNYGAAAQEYFSYKTDNLMNANLTAEQQALVSSYDASLFAGAVKAAEAKIGAFAATSSGFAKKSASVSFDGAFAINYYFTANAEVAGDVTFYYWTADAYANAETLTAENASGTAVMAVSGNGAYWAQVSGIAAKQIDDTYYVAAVYADAAGNNYCTGVIAYSLSTYCVKNAVEGNAMQALAEATAMYGYYAKVYFGNEV